MRLRDGRVIHFQTRALPDGGRMLTYFDITDLKRNEEYATRARDIAETALADLGTKDQELNTHDAKLLGELLHGNETRIYGDQAYRGQKQVIRAHAPKARDFINRRYRIVALSMW